LLPRQKGTRRKAWAAREYRRPALTIRSGDEPISLRTLLENTHSYLPKLAQQFRDGKVSRREFLRTSTLLGLSSAVAYAIVGLPESGGPTRRARAASGGTVRLSLRVQPIASPHTYSWVQDSMMSRNVIEYLTLTGGDNVTRPWLCERWEASDDLKTWTLHLREDVKWSNGERFTADHVIWNIKRCLDPAIGSSVMSFMDGFMLRKVDTGEKDKSGNAKVTSQLWDANAVEKVDDFTVRLNGQRPKFDIPEVFFHYPFAMMHPSSNGDFPGVGSLGTGWAEIVEYELGTRCVVKKRPGYWAGDGALDSVEFIDHGDDVAVALGAISTKQVDGIWEVKISQLAALQKLDNIKLYRSDSAQTAVARMQPIHDTWKDARVRKAMRLAIDQERVLQFAYGGNGLPAEHHHVAPLHPEYAKIPFVRQDIEAAKKLLAEAGVPDGFKTEINCLGDPDWEAKAVVAMAGMWKEIGVEVKVNVLPSTEYWDKWDKETNPFSFTSWTHRPVATMVMAAAYRTGGPWNESKWSNPAFDELITRAEGTIDVEERRQVMAEIETLMQEEGPIVQPLWRSMFSAMDKKVEGYEAHPSLYIFPWKWSLEV
jgi:peptide/nickel transport system substrate-binding protein